MSRVWLLLFIAAIFPLAGQAKVVELSLKKVKKYDRRVQTLEEGDTVVFNNGERFTLGKYLGGGSENMIFALDRDHMIRIPSRALAGLAPRNTIDGAMLLTALGVPSVQVEGAPVKSGKIRSRIAYAIAERVKPRFTFDEFLYGAGGAAELNPEQEKEIVKKFLDFARKTALFEYIDAAGPDQIVYTKDQQWILLDWSRYHRLIDPNKIRSEEDFLKTRHLFSLMMERAPGNLSTQERRRNRMAGFDEWDIGQTYLPLNGKPRWLAIKGPIQSAIEKERRAIYRRYKGNLKTALERISQKNLITHQPLGYNSNAPRRCLANIYEILEFISL